MQAGSIRSRALWLLPIVLIVGALMIVPAASISAAPTGAPSGTTAPAVSGAAGSALTSGLVSGATHAISAHSLSAPSSSLSGSPIQSSSALSRSSSAANSLSRAIQQLEASNANPATIRLVQNVQSGIASGALNPHAVYLPNFNLLAHPVSSPSQAISLYYTASPAPMGIGDFGIGNNSTYTFNTSAVLGQAVLDSFNASAGSLYEATGNYYWNGFAANSPGNPYQSGMQLNTVLANVTFPGSSADPLGSGVFWTQNVPDFEGNSIQFIDNIWNFSASGAGMNSGTLLSYDGVLVPGQFYYAIGPTIPAAYPMTMQLYNNVSVVNGRDVLTYGYRVVEPSQTYTGIYDTIVFNSPVGSTTGLAPAFRVDGNVTSPGGGIFDSELVFTGPGAGSNTVITNLTGQLTMSYLTSQGSWAAPRAAYDYGGNTGETATGVAATWSGTTVNVVQGPSFLYGLWGTAGGVPAGAISFTGQSDPNYAFTFMAENASGTFYNAAYAPSDATGVVSTMLPPSLPTPYTSYGLVALADEYAPLTTSFTGAQADFPIALVSSPGTLDAPLYMNGEAQATALATAVTGAANAPYTFSNMVLHLDPYTGTTFNLLNDWEFTTFNLVQAQGVTTPLVFDHIAQGPNFGVDTLYYYPYFGGSFFNIPNGSQEFVDYGGVGDQFMNLDLPGFMNPIGLPLGGAISLWNTNNVTVTNVSATNLSYGVWASTTSGTTVTNSMADDAVAFSILASSGAVGYNLSATDYGASVLAEGSTGAALTYLNATVYSDGIVGFWMNGTTADYLTSQSGSQATYLEGGIGYTFDQVWADDSAGLIGYDLTTLSAADGSYSNDSIGVVLFGATGVTVTSQYANYSEAVYFDQVNSSSITGVTAVNGSEGADLFDSSDITVSGVTASDVGTLGVVIESGSGNVTVSGTSATASAVGAMIQGSSDVAVTGTNASQLAVGVVAESGANNIVVSGTTASGEAVGVAFQGVSQGTITATSGSDLSVAVLVEDSTLVRISGVSATNSAATALYDPTVMSVLGLPVAAVVTASDTSTTVTNVTASGYGAAYFDSESYALSVSSVNSSSDQYAVVLNGTSDSLLTGITSVGDGQGALIEESQYGYFAESNTLTASRFTNDTGYGVDFAPGAEYNTVYNNQFVGNNGATSVYSPSAIQAFSYYTNYFYTCTGLCTSGIGNYWADWHTYGPNGLLAPYPITGSVSDLFPLGPAETFSVTFTETGLSSGAKWSVSVDGTKLTSTNATMTVSVPMGTYTYAVVASGYNAAPSSGSVTVSGPGQSVAVSFSATTSLATTSDLNTYFGAALAIAVIALLLALLALFWRRKPKPSASPAPPTAWTPPPTAEGAAPPPGASGGGSEGSGGPGASSWSEGTGGTGTDSSGTR